MNRNIIVGVVIVTALFFTTTSFGKSRSNLKPIGSGHSGVKPLGGVKPPVKPSKHRVEIGSIDVTRKTKNFQTGIGDHTKHNRFDRLLLIVKEGGHGGVIVNTLLVKVNNKYRKKTLGLRTKNGENFISVDIPQGAQEIRMSLDSGAGSHVTFYLVRKHGRR